MLTAQQHKIFQDCAYQISSAAWKAYWTNSETAEKLMAYNTLLEPPTVIRDANRERCMRLFEKTDELRELRNKADKAVDYVCARPYLCTATYWDGRETQFVCTGLLPNFDRAPEDEAAALQAVTEYHAREAVAS